MKPKRTILCVDDNEQSLSIRKVMLETRGYRVLAYTDAQQALQRFAQGGVDLVLTDLIMPGLDGSKLIEGVKDISPETPAILLSGKVKIYERETGADVFLAKGNVCAGRTAGAHPAAAGPQTRTETSSSPGARPSSATPRRFRLTSLNISHGFCTVPRIESFDLCISADPWLPGRGLCSAVVVRSML